MVFMQVHEWQEPAQALAVTGKKHVQVFMRFHAA